MKNPIIIYGKTGQLASALAEILGLDAIIFASTEYDFSNIENVRKALGGIKAKVIINATAYTDVNKAESEEDAAYKANALIPEALAKYCLEKDMVFIHYSTDYVFAGDGDKPHTESAPTSPLNAYGRTKLAGEEKIKQIGGKYLIFRTSWVYDHSRKNFLTTMLKLGTERETLSIVSDQFGAPTYAPHLAAATLEILQKASDSSIFPSGIYHLCNSGSTCWHGFAVEIFKEAKANNIPLKVTEVKAISANEFPTPAKRPQNSRLDCSLAQKTFGVEMPLWQDGLKESFKLKLKTNLPN